MKKVIFTTLCFLLLTTISSAQSIDFGLRAGVNLFDVTVDEFKNANGTVQSVESGDREVGFHAGVYGQVSLPGFFVRPELLYTFQNSQVQYTNNGGEEKTLDIDYSRFDIPVIVGTKLGPVRLGAGPVASFAISEPDGAFNKSLSDASFGYQLGIGFDISKISIDLRYEGPFGKYADQLTIEGQTYQADSRSNFFMIGLGFELL